MRGFSKVSLSNLLCPKNIEGAKGEGCGERLEGRRDLFPASNSCQHLSAQIDGKDHSICRHPRHPWRTPSGSWMSAMQCPLRSPHSPSTSQETPPQRPEPAERCPRRSQHTCMAPSQLAQCSQVVTSSHIPL